MKAEIKMLLEDIKLCRERNNQLYADCKRLQAENKLIDADNKLIKKEFKSLKHDNIYFWTKYYRLNHFIQLYLTKIGLYIPEDPKLPKSKLLSVLELEESSIILARRLLKSGVTIDTIMTDKSNKNRKVKSLRVGMNLLKLGRKWLQEIADGL